MKRFCSWIAITIILLAAGCNRLSTPAPDSSPTSDAALTSFPTQTTTLIPARTSTATIQLEPTLDLTFAYEAEHRTPVENIPYSVNCVPEGTLIHCHDSLLKISFAYPQGMWADIQSKLEWGSDNGYEYRYFERAHSEQPFAGGLSRFYAEGREGMDLDFGAGDTSTMPVADICAESDLCFEVKPHVILSVSPSVQLFCSIGKTVVNLPPYALVRIQLPDNQFINGFVITKYFLSDQAAIQLNKFVGLAEGELWPHCNGTTVSGYQAIMDALNNGKLSGFVDNETLSNYTNILSLAESIEFDK